MFKLPLRPAILSIVSTSLTLGTAAEIPHIIGTGWQRITWPDPWTMAGANTAPDSFTFRIYPGQNATMTLVDGGWNNERIEFYNFGNWTSGWSTSRPEGAVDMTWAATFDQAFASSVHEKGIWSLPPGLYRLTFRLQRGSVNYADEAGKKVIHSAFKIDITETPDADEDRLADAFETNTGVYVSPVNTGTDPSKGDTDGDGLGDREEVFVTLTDPNKKDTDGDGFADGAEIAAGKSPLDPDSKPASMEIRSAVEVTINTEIGKNYRVEWSADLAAWESFPEIIEGDGNPVTRFYSTRNHPARYFRSAIVLATPK